MKGLITGIKRMAIHDGEGIRTTVFFKGCPLKCVWCHNPENICFEKELAFYERKCIGCASCVSACQADEITMSQGKPTIDRGRCGLCMKECVQVCPSGALQCYGEEWDVEMLTEELLKDVSFFENSGGGVTLSGGECLAQSKFAIELAKSLYQKGISVNVDTCGYVKTSVLQEIMPYVDTFLYDVKAISPEVHKLCTGKDNTVILNNLRFLSEAGNKIEIRYPYVKGYNDGECEAIGQFLLGLHGITKIKVLGYHSYADAKYQALGMCNTLPQVTVTSEDVEVAVETLRNFGLNAVNGMHED